MVKRKFDAVKKIVLKYQQDQIMDCVDCPATNDMCAKSHCPRKDWYKLVQRAWAELRTHGQA